MTIDEKQVMQNLQENLEERYKKMGVDVEVYYEDPYIEVELQNPETGMVYVSASFNVLGHICRVTYSTKTQRIWYDPADMQKDYHKTIEILEKLKCFYCVLPSKRELPNK